MKTWKTCISGPLERINESTRTQRVLWADEVVWQGGMEKKGVFRILEVFSRLESRLLISSTLRWSIPPALWDACIPQEVVRACKGGGYSGMTMSMSCAQQRRRLMVSYDECNSNVQYSLVTSMPYSKWSQKTSWLNHSFLPEKQEEIPSRMFDE